MKDKKIEILAPAGSFESLVAAVNAGADGVYIGGSRYGARAYANNLDQEQMMEAIDYAHLHDCRLYMTVNTLMKEEELRELPAYLAPYYERGLDAVIVQDMGAFCVIKREFPDLPIHASTQMTVTGVYGARILQGLGASRVVTARELSLEEIREIHENVEIEIESFVHGALCYGYSGQCLYSSLIGGRSGNRGRCAQPCRLPYEVKEEQNILNKKDEQYVMSLKDLCALDLIPDLAEAGIYSFKIEGRMKSPRYTGGVVSIYRKYVDQYLAFGRSGYRVSEEDRTLLSDLFDRGGQTEGYYRQHNGKSMVVMKEKPSFRQANESLFAMLDETYVNHTKQEAIRGNLSLSTGVPSHLTLKCKDVEITLEDQSPEPAKRQPMTSEQVSKQIKKTGGTPFYFEELEISISGDLFLPVQALNQLRRNGLELLKEEILKKYRRETVKSVETVTDQTPESQPAGGRDKVGAKTSEKTSAKISPGFSAAVEEIGQLSVLLDMEKISDIYLEASIEPKHWESSVTDCHQAGKRCFLMFPYIFRTEARVYFDRQLQRLRGAGFDGVVVRSLEEVEYLKEKGLCFPMIFDHTIYQWNREARNFYESMGAMRLTLPLELNSRELSSYGAGEELMVYGRLPMMVSAQCIRKSTSGCDKKSGFLVIRDRMGKEFPVKHDCKFCYNVIYNTSPLSLHGQETAIDRLSPGSLRFHFTTETKEEVKRVICDFMEGMGSSDFTRGHFKRGVE